MNKTAWALFAVLCVALLALISGISLYLERRSEILELQQAIAATWQSADALVKERAELALELADSARPFATRERATLRRVEESYARLAKAFTAAERIAANDALSAALSDLLTVGERYPELRSQPGYKRLQDELADIEKRAAAERRKYNHAVQDYNTLLQLFPSNVVASLEGFEREEAYFRSTERARQAEPAGAFSDPVDARVP